MNNVGISCLSWCLALMYLQNCRQLPLKYSYRIAFYSKNCVLLSVSCLYNFSVSFPIVLWITSFGFIIQSFAYFHVHFICLFIHVNLLCEVFTLYGTWSRTTLLIYLNSCQSWLADLDYGSLCKIFPEGYEIIIAKLRCGHKITLLKAQ